MSLYKDTTYKDKSVHRYSIKASDRGIDPTTELYIDGEKTEEWLIDLIQE